MARAKTASVTTTTIASAAAQGAPNVPAAPLLQFDFEGRRARGSSAPSASASPGEASQREGSIKEAIIRWLNEQL